MSMMRWMHSLWLHWEVKLSHHRVLIFHDFMVTEEYIWRQMWILARCYLICSCLFPVLVLPVFSPFNLITLIEISQIFMSYSITFFRLSSVYHVNSWLSHMSKLYLKPLISWLISSFLDYLYSSLIYLYTKGLWMDIEKILKN